MLHSQNQEFELRLNWKAQLYILFVKIEIKVTEFIALKNSKNFIDRVSWNIIYTIIRKLQVQM